ncbi:hypothetical protein IMAU20013_00219 [Lactiplantibacillus plantarum]|nr:hypothetical protein [Lactiplantibacillus plantarum]MCG0879807.1 hypothetical protein [Lactiplantibacillus plantarum]
MANRYFDLNIEKVLDNWEVHHAIREIIANALDETVLTGCREPDIFKDDTGKWHVHDYGRGLNYEHFTQNQNPEKIDANNVIGKFGVGLKDALAVLNRANRDAQIDSKFAHISLKMHTKEGFQDVETLHAVFEAAKDTQFVGTEFVMEVTDDEIKKAKRLFLYFENKTPIDATTYGEIYTKGSEVASIFVNGVKVAEEENYTFDYNITKQNAALKKALNRERSFLGRTAYSGTVKNMLLNSSSLEVISVLLDELKKIPEGTNGDEINYLDVQVYAVKKYNALKPSVFMSSLDAYELTNDDKERIRESGRELVIVPENVYEHVKDDHDENGNQIGTFDVVQQEYSDNFEYQYISEGDLTEKQLKVWQERLAILNHFGWRKLEKNIFISKTINVIVSGDTFGVCDGSRIIIKQSVLNDSQQFSTVLIHEILHLTTGFPDNTREFENELGKIVGQLSVELLNKPIQSDVIKDSANSGTNKTSSGGFLSRLFGK